MTWLTWRQLRTQAAVVFSAVAVLAAVLAATGPSLAHRYRTDPAGFLADLTGTDTALYVLCLLAVLAFPFVIGLFWGAPLVTRELDAGTYKLAWTQSCTRTRWLLTKLGLGGLAAMAATGLLSLAVSWWSSPIDTAIAARRGLPGPGLLLFPRLSPEIFGERGIAPLGYAAFAFMLGVTIGFVTRRLLPAMALFLAAFAVVQIVMTGTVLPRLVPPAQEATTISAADLTFIGRDGNVNVTVSQPGAWLTAEHTVNAAGQPVQPPSWVANCPLSSRRGSQACFGRLTRLGYRQVVSYQPASRFWALQREDTLIYLVLTVLLAGVCTWSVRRLS